jgi:hypothetical protein
MEQWEMMNKAMDRILGTDAGDAIRAHNDALQAKDAEMKEALRTELAAASARIADAIRWPMTSRSEVERAMVHLHDALKVAREIDPE